MHATPDWAGSSGDSWADHWQRTDRALAGLAPALHSAILDAAPAGPFRALDIGTGPGSTALALAAARPDAEIVACDLSPSLSAVARGRAGANPRLRFVTGSAEAVAAAEGPFDLFFSRHGVMFFADPVDAFRGLREAAATGGGIVFSCFQAWPDNRWASETADAVAGGHAAAPDRSPGGFAFAEPDYVQGLLTAAGWRHAERRAAPFSYVAGEGDDPEKEAMALLAKIGPAARLLDQLADGDRPAAIQRMRRVVADHCRDHRVEFPAAAWIWSAQAE